MAKSPRKASSLPQVPQGSKSLSKTSNKPSIGGKNFKGYTSSKYFPHNSTRSRRFSIVDSSSSDSEKTFTHKDQHSSDSESSLTAVSENDDDNRTSTHFANKNHKLTSRKSTYAKKYTKNKKTAKAGRKRTPKKSIDWSNHNWNQILKHDNDDDDDMEEDNEDDDMEEDEDNDDDNDDELESPDEIGLEGLYSLMNSGQQSDASDVAQSSQDEDEDVYSSSDDDSDVDFVKLQAERKARSMKTVHALKGLNNNKQVQELSLSSDSDSEVSSTPVKPVKSRRKSEAKKPQNAIPKPKFGRRKSEAALPEDINFTFDFGDLGNESVVFDDDLEYDYSSQNASRNDAEQDSVSSDNIQEEDVGEEVNFSLPPTPKDDGKNTNLDFEYDSPIIQVPKINEEELNSDEDYEIDDNELLATLHADNDLDELVDDYSSSFRQSRNNSMGSLGDDDPFLKEEEKFLVNEFENNGFDDELEDLSMNEMSHGSSMLSSFNNMNNKKQVVQYESSIENESDGYEDEDDNDFEDFIDFNVPLFDKDLEDIKDVSDDKENTVAQYFRKSQVLNNKSKNKAKKSSKNSVINSDEEDDSYLWNYFFSSGESNDEDDVERYNDASEDEELDVDGLFSEMNEANKKNRKSVSSALPVRRKLLTLTSNIGNNELFDLEDEYDSGESTDVDLSLPVSSDKSNVGSKKAKEVLSSKTADYRPPVLGTWVTLDSKPFGIIDGLSTRTLVNSNSNLKNMEPRTKGRKSIIPTGADDLALGLDELLNISELDDDDENDAKIWRDFNNQKKQVPLGAFRNKSVLQNSVIYSQYGKPSNNHEFNQTSVYPRRNSVSRGIVKKPTNARRNSSATALESAAVSKQARRRSSFVEAVSEGFRPTKSGLFSENALADIEEVLGDDNEFLSLIKGL